VFVVKKGSPARGLAWEVIVESLNKIDSPKFQLKDKREVREMGASEVEIYEENERGRKREWNLCG